MQATEIAGTIDDIRYWPNGAAHVVLVEDAGLIWTIPLTQATADRLREGRRVSFVGYAEPGIRQLVNAQLVCHGV